MQIRPCSTNWATKCFWPAAEKKPLRVFEAQQRSQIKLLILDLIMPDLGGEIVYDRVKALTSRYSRVILSSGYSIEGQAESISEKGVRRFYSKTLQPQPTRQERSRRPSFHER